MRAKRRRGKPTPQEIFDELRDSIGWEPIYNESFYQRIIAAGFNRARIKQAFVIAQIVKELGPISVRGAMYRAVSAGMFPNTDRPYYRATCKILLKLRRRGCIDYSKIVDS